MLLNLVVHSEIAEQFLQVAKALSGVELVGDERARNLVSSIAAATNEDWFTEYLDLKMSVRVVDSLMRP